MKQHLISTLILLCSVMAVAQELGPTVVSSGGGEGQAQGVKLSWTLGELATQSSSSEKNIYTEGYQQPMLTIEKATIDEVVAFIPEASLSSIQEVTIRPNPVASEMHIDFMIPLDTDATLTIHNAQGQLVHSSRLARGTNHKSLDIRHLAPGIYTLICINANALVTHPYRIIKI